MTCGSAACCVERLRLSVAGEHQPTPSAPRGRLSLPGGAETEEWASGAGKAEPFRTAGRQSRMEYDSFPLIWKGEHGHAPLLPESGIAVNSL
jgi:hypothetical protein